MKEKQWEVLSFSEAIEVMVITEVGEGMAMVLVMEAADTEAFMGAELGAGVGVITKQTQANTSIIPDYHCPWDEVKRTGCKGPKDCMYPNTTNCNHFVKCTDECVAYDWSCPGGLQWNDYIKLCDNPSSLTFY
ncbi:unnamed protein product [Oppiella nova]|uniref:Chitin-binding type-2 domain-containing protein n=1 Tax=Oppiella nova TaxID=334625 RepID=A0A7R9QR04_9ACAR|nr:unnamed protein product [Oppiella nova]CAG2171893.1 unnamed protein product [Oppiella nova]